MSTPGHTDCGFFHLVLLFSFIGFLPSNAMNGRILVDIFSTFGLNKKKKLSRARFCIQQNNELPFWATRQLIDFFAKKLHNILHFQHSSYCRNTTTFVGVKMFPILFEAMPRIFKENINYNRKLGPINHCLFFISFTIQ